MKKLLTLLLVCTTIIAVGQKKQKDTAKVHLETKDGLVFYEKVIDSLDGQSKDQVFNTSLKWLADSFVDSKEVIQVKDKETGNIVGAGNLEFATTGFAGTTSTLKFMIEISARDKKSRIRLYQFSDYYTPSYSIEAKTIPIEKRYNEYLKQIQFPKANRNYYQAMRIKLNR